jgi:hypothetical protein
MFLFKMGEVNVVPIHAMKAYWGRGFIDPLFLNHGARCGWVINITPRPPYHWERTTVHIKQDAV